MTDTQIFQFIATRLSLTAAQVQKVSTLLDEGATIPFLARYRREVTGDLDEEQLRAIRDDLDAVRLLEERRSVVLRSISEQGKLTDELEKAIRACTDLKTLEDLYLPYKPKRKTRASMAREKGLEPLAEMILNQEVTRGNPADIAAGFIDPEKGVETADQALQGAKDIVAEWVNENAQVREKLRQEFRKYGAITARKASSVTDRTVYEAYYEFSCKVKFLKPHQTLALNRGEREGILMVNLEVFEEQCLDHIDDVVFKTEDSIFTDYLLDASEDAFKRLLFPALERELRNELTEAADQHAIETFAENMGNLLMQPPLANKVVMGIDPAFRTGCKVAVIDPTGRYLEGNTIYPTEPFRKVVEAEAIVNHLIDKHKVTLIAIGNGTASRETEAFIAELIQRRKSQHPTEELFYLIISEAGASVYSASPTAREEFPDLDAAQRGNISIARRVLDPLAELVKIDPKSVGVGLYQHDVNQYKLSKKLDDVVESCVNTVGVNLNTASAALLTHISGLSKTISENIIQYREKNGKFTSRDRLLQVPGVGAFKYQQAAGFLRVAESDNPLDNTAIHPESYDAARQLCAMFEIDLAHLSAMQQTLSQKFQHIKKSEVAEKLGIGIPTLELIIENLLKPGRDPRESLPKPILRQDILKLEDLKQGDQLEGTVRNVVDFGAFVDLGVKQDGLLHVSRMSLDGSRVKSPHDVVSVGDIVTVEVETIDMERGRIGIRLVGKS
ncbi:MAG: transcriptional accessory factor YhgF [Bacteroidetes bacterium HLUCCA01]|nr:MAG: transcriptional accessory factor YhgF [Bacteroidetes bacterium HLUCCA01]